jgi:hypothetical protein
MTAAVSATDRGMKAAVLRSDPYPAQHKVLLKRWKAQDAADHPPVRPDVRI